MNVFYPASKRIQMSTVVQKTKIKELNAMEFKRLCQRVSPDLKITSVYNEETNTTIFTLEFPSWLYKTYNTSIVDKVISCLSPIASDILNEQYQRSPMSIAVELRCSKGNVASSCSGGSSVKSCNNGGCCL